MKIFRFSVFTVLLSMLIVVGCKRDNSATLLSSAEEKLMQEPGEITVLDKPSIQCSSATPTSITLLVTAGSTGTPSGFTIVWMSQPQFFANGGDWYADADPRLCQASFTGAQYLLAPGQSITVNIGAALATPGVTSNCAGPLDCVIAKYVFRGFANATATAPRSDYSGPGWECQTEPCPPQEEGQCTYTQGYWKTHGPVGCAKGNNSNEWAVTSLTLGTVLYTDAQLCTIMNTPVAGNGLISLAHQLIAAKLNIANGSSNAAIAAAITAADAMIGGLKVPPTGGGVLSPATVSSLVTQLTNYNEGLIGPGHCD